jgi:hypothetical protein
MCYRPIHAKLEVAIKNGITIESTTMIWGKKEKSLSWDVTAEKKEARFLFLCELRRRCMMLGAKRSKLQLMRLRIEKKWFGFDGVLVVFRGFKAIYFESFLIFLEIEVFGSIGNAHFLKFLVWNVFWTFKMWSL